jgi:3'(2'), 5'-bisphosphate nucleotidase
MAFEKELATALAAARQAGTWLLEEYQRFQAIPDAPASITTEADRQTQELVISHLASVFPKDAYCAEEKTVSLERLPRSGARLWVIDPIDGTRGFARKNGEFSVMIAFVHDGSIEAGVVYEPARDRLTYARRGGRCWQQNASGETAVPCQVSSIAALPEATLTQTHSRSPSTPSPSAAALQPGRVLESYSAGIKLALVARGEADVYVNTYRAFSDWDICAGAILVEEAGGKVTGLRGENLLYGLPEARQNFGLVASNGQLHEQALTQLAGVELD